MINHDKHQYYFEKFLREEMVAEERQAFEAKLKEDVSLRMAFEYYKLNRQALLQQLIDDHKLLRKDNRLNQLFFLLISLTGIAITVNYFVYKNSPNSNPTQEKPSNIFVRYIPFLNWENRKEKKTETPIGLVKDSLSTIPSEIANNDQVENLEPSLDPNERLTSDKFLADSFVTIWDSESYQQWKQFELTKDSANTDSVYFIPMPNIKSKEKAWPILVEYWESPFQYKGYLYQNNKLVLYGIPFQSQIIVYKSPNQLMVHTPMADFPLTEQTNFIPF